MARVLVHQCVNPFLEPDPRSNCKCARHRGNWITPAEAKSRMNQGLAVHIGESMIAVCGRLPHYHWPRMVTPEVIRGNAGLCDRKECREKSGPCGHIHRDREFVKEIAKDKILTNPIVYIMTKVRGKIRLLPFQLASVTTEEMLRPAGEPIITYWGDQRTNANGTKDR